MAAARRDDRAVAAWNRSLCFIYFLCFRKVVWIIFNTLKIPHLEEYCSIDTTVFSQGQTHQSILNCGILEILYYQTQSECVI
jgi:hypothetical protein